MHFSRSTHGRKEKKGGWGFLAYQTHHVDDYWSPVNIHGARVIRVDGTEPNMFTPIMDWLTKVFKRR